MVLGQYFSVLIKIIRYIHFSDLSEEEKNDFSEILWSLLSQNEMILLFYFGLSDYGKENVKPFIERYALLSNLQRHLVIPAPAIGYYHPHAFGAGTPE